MGYTTEFWGQVEVVPPLNVAEVEYLQRFAHTRRMNRKSGPYTADPAPDGYGQDCDDGIDSNGPPPGQPGLWCQWTPDDDGKYIGWDGGEKFYDAPEWMAYIIEHFLRSDASARRTGDPQFKDFTFDHVVNGTIDAQGEESGDRWKLVVTDNKVETAHARFEWD